MQVLENPQPSTRPAASQYEPRLPRILSAAMGRTIKIRTGKGKGKSQQLEQRLRAEAEARKRSDGEEPLAGSAGAAEEQVEEEAGEVRAGCEARVRALCMTRVLRWPLLLCACLVRGRSLGGFRSKALCLPVGLRRLQVSGDSGPDGVDQCSRCCSVLYVRRAVVLLPMSRRMS